MLQISREDQQVDEINQKFVGKKSQVNRPEKKLINLEDTLNFQDISLNKDCSSKVTEDARQKVRISSRNHIVQGRPDPELSVGSSKGLAAEELDDSMIGKPSGDIGEIRA